VREGRTEGGKYVFELTPAIGSRTYILSAESEPVRADWIVSITRAINEPAVHNCTQTIGNESAQKVGSDSELQLVSTSTRGKYNAFECPQMDANSDLRAMRAVLNGMNEVYESLKQEARTIGIAETVWQLEPESPSVGKHVEWRATLNSLKQQLVAAHIDLPK
jgi:hypothetical protein